MLLLGNSPKNFQHFYSFLKSDKLQHDKFQKTLNVKEELAISPRCAGPKVLLIKIEPISPKAIIRNEKATFENIIFFIFITMFDTISK